MKFSIYWIHVILDDSNFLKEKLLWSVNEFSLLPLVAGRGIAILYTKANQNLKNSLSVDLYDFVQFIKIWYILF